MARADRAAGGDLRGLSQAPPCRFHGPARSGEALAEISAPLGHDRGRFHAAGRRALAAGCSVVDNPDEDSVLCEQLVKHAGATSPAVSDLLSMWPAVGVLKHWIPPGGVEVGRPDQHSLHHVR